MKPSRFCNRAYDDVTAAWTHLDARKQELMKLHDSLAKTEFLLREYVDLYHIANEECRRVKNELQEVVRDGHLPLFAQGAPRHKVSSNM